MLGVKRKKFESEKVNCVNKSKKKKTYRNIDITGEEEILVYNFKEILNKFYNS